jgi:energy-coupling factor transport system ATP-binding protein
VTIRVEHLTHTYNTGLAYETKAVDDVSFDVADGEFIGVIGHTGSGKSTLIQHLNGILKPGSGRIWIDDTDITEKGVKMLEIRRRVGLSFQYPEYQLFEETVYKDISFGPRNLGLPDDEIDKCVREAMELVRIDFDEVASRSPFDLSGGQKRRVALAGVIAMKPDVLILDEPTAGLDPGAHEDILSMIRSVRERTGSIVMLVSHNMGDIAAMADRVFVMDAGKLVRSGAPADVFADAEYLRGMGLGLPPATEMAGRLGLNGTQRDGRPCEKSVIAASEPQSHQQTFGEIAGQARNDDSFAVPEKEPSLCVGAILSMDELVEAIVRSRGEDGP